MKRLIIYLLYGTGLLLLIYLGVHHYEELRLTAGRSFDQTPLVRFVAFFAIVFGTELSP